MNSMYLQLMTLNARCRQWLADESGEADASTNWIGGAALLIAFLGILMGLGRVMFPEIVDALFENLFTTLGLTR